MACSGNSATSENANPSQYYSKGQAQLLLKQIVEKTAKKAENQQNSSEKTQYIEDQTRQYIWHYAYKQDGGTYFLVSRPAPSLYGKRVGIGGFFRTPDNLRITGFKEVFHTFKMKPELLSKKSAILFEKMVNHEDLSSFYPNPEKENDPWIEFPDALNQYDSLSQSWVLQTSR